MESILLESDSDDSASGDVSKTTTTAAASLPPVAATPPVAAGNTTVPPDSAADRQQRLKSLYSPANKPRIQPQQQQQQKQQQQQQQQKPSQQQQHHASQQHSQPSGGPSRNSAPHSANAPSGGVTYQQSHPTSQAPRTMHHHQQGGVQQTSSSSHSRQVPQPQQPSRRPSLSQPPQMTMNPGYPQSSSQRTSHGGQRPPTNTARRSMPAPPRGGPMARVTSDPFEPTPVSKMIGAPSSSSSGNPNYPSMQSSAGYSSMSSNTAPPSRPPNQPYRPPSSTSATTAADARSTQDAAQRKQKERFLIFTRVLMKYLEQKDPKIHVQVKEIIRDCAQRNSRKEDGYESVTAAMKRRLKEVVNDQYWQRAEVYLEHFLKQKGKSSTRPSRPDSNSARSSATAPPRSIPSAPRPSQPPSLSRPSSTMPPPEAREDPAKKNPKRSSSGSSKKNPSAKPPVTPTSPRPQSDDALKSVDYALPYNGSILGDNMQTMLTAEQAALLYDVPTKKNLPPSFPLQNWRQRNVVTVQTAFVRCERSAWVNEDIAARDDQTLAVLSEGAQIYLKSVLEKALHAARQRQNLDAIRLWHQQHSSQPPEIGIRLGCDVNRQLALSQANDTLAVKRMEAALERRPESESINEVNSEAMLAATSMSDLALKPKLSKAQKDLESSTKRNLDVFLGQGRHEPPFGRVPKVARLEVVDFQTGMQFVPAGRFKKAGTYLSSFFY